MKAIVVDETGGPEVLVLKEHAVPTSLPGEIVIRVEYASVNYADVKARRGKKGKSEKAFVPGLDACGVVERVGEGVKEIQPGQRVMTFPVSGSYATHVRSIEALTFPIPDELAFKEAAAYPTVTFLAYFLLKRIARIQKGDSVIVHAASGGAGLALVQLARVFGAGIIIGTTGSLEKQEAILQAGADHVFTYDTFAAETKRVTNGKGVMHVFDSIAGHVTTDSFNVLAPYGTLVQFGNAGGEPGLVSTNLLHSSCRSVRGFSLGTTRKLHPEWLKEVADDVLGLILSGSIVLPVDGVYSLRDAARAHERMESREHTGKILLRNDV